MSASKYIKSGIIVGIIIFIITHLFSKSVQSFIIRILFHTDFEYSIGTTTPVLIIAGMVYYVVLSAIFSFLLYRYYNKIPGKNLKRKITVALLSIVFLYTVFGLISVIFRGSMLYFVYLFPGFMLWNILLIIIYAYLFEFVFKKLSEQNIRQTISPKTPIHS